MLWYFRSVFSPAFFKNEFEKVRHEIDKGIDRAVLTQSLIGFFRRQYSFDVQKLLEQSNKQADLSQNPIQLLESIRQVIAEGSLRKLKGLFIEAKEDKEEQFWYF